MSDVEGSVKKIITIYTFKLVLRDGIKRHILAFSDRYMNGWSLKTGLIVLSYEQ